MGPPLAPARRGTGPGRAPRRPAGYNFRVLDALARLGERLVRDTRDGIAAEACLPSAARRVTATTGWLYPVTTELGDRYQLFLWFDGAAYQVMVVEPALDRAADPHVCHLLPGARLCLGADPGGGMPTLEGAFTRSVLWANGYGVWRRTGRFPF